MALPTSERDCVARALLPATASLGTKFQGTKIPSLSYHKQAPLRWGGGVCAESIPFARPAFVLPHSTRQSLAACCWFRSLPLLTGTTRRRTPTRVTSRRVAWCTFG